jgi:hypothetical protein
MALTWFSARNNRNVHIQSTNGVCELYTKKKSIVAVNTSTDTIKSLAGLLGAEETKCKWRIKLKLGSTNLPLGFMM